MPQESVYDFDAGYDEEVDGLPESAPVATKPPASKPAQEAPVAGERATDGPSHNPMSLRFAKDYDFTDEEIAGMTPRELDLAVGAAHRAFLKSSREATRGETLRGDNRPAPAEPAPAEPEDEYAEFAEEVHPNVIKAIKKGRDADKAKIEALQAKVDAAEGERAERQRAQVYDAVDAEFAKMPAGIQAAIGTGDRNTITKAERAIRKAILAEAEADQTPGLTFAQKMHAAAKDYARAEAGAAAEDDEEAAVLPIKRREPAAKPVPPKDPSTGKFSGKTPEEKEEAWRGGGSAKPTSRESPLPKGERRAMETARKLMIARGMMSEDDMPEGSFPKTG